MTMSLSSYFTIPLFLCLSSLHLVSPFPSFGGQIDYDYNYNYNYYERSCPRLRMIVQNGVWAAFKTDTRIAHCSYSSSIHFAPTAYSFHCSKIFIHFLIQSGGPYYPLSFGRKDGFTASEKAANEQLPSPIEPLENITAKFTSKGLDMKDVVVLSGAHTIGFAQCFTFKRRLFDFKGTGKPDPTLESSALANLQGMCPNKDASNRNLAPLDSASTYRFDNAYYVNLVNGTGLLESDQALMRDPKTSAIVTAYSSNSYLFSADFASSMTKLSNLGILTGSNGQIRNKCGSVN
ncbi:hypothetical protein OIU78_008533 [Salix suchowensis]|nr:hypothetical protein OIU78_008533 [Salix suchowensis]